jgi:hypothetical protein
MDSLTSANEGNTAGAVCWTADPLLTNQARVGYPRGEVGAHRIRQDVTDTDSPGDTSIQVALDYVASEAPEDVLRTMAGLRDNGWRATRSWVRPEMFGTALAEFRKVDGEDQIVRDRGQWMVSIRLADWNDWVDLGLVVDAKSGRREWDEPSGNPYENKQLPVGIKWADAVPDALEWIATTENAESKLDELRAERFRRRPGDVLPGQCPHGIALQCLLCDGAGGHTFVPPTA